MSTNPCNTHSRKHERNTFKPAPEWVRLPGFVEAGTTYESHTFWVEWTHSKWDTVARPTARLWVEHGAGVESLEPDCHLVRALRDMLGAGMTAAAFHLCWHAFEATRAAAVNERTFCKQELFKAFVEGRLKKRKQRGSGAYKVWVEEEREPASA